MDNEQQLLMMRALATSYLKQSECYIREFVPRKLLAVLDEWLPKRRFIDPAIFTNRAICDLEAHAFKERELRISVLAGSAAAISDDIIDSRSDIPFKYLRLLENHGKTTESGHLGLFFAFNRGLIRELPDDFRERFKNTIKQYNKSQEDSAKLFDTTITKKEIVDIKNRAGGYSILLLHAMIFSNTPYRLSNPLPQKHLMTKRDALYIFGAWLSRVDDLWDATKDRARGMKQLATEGIVTWNSLQSETQQMKEHLEFHFSRSRVNRIIEEHYAPLIDETIFRKYGGNK